MKHYSVQWSLVNANNLSEQHYAHFFLLVRNGKVQYLGNVHRRDLAKVIPATVAASNMNMNSTQVYLGRIRERLGYQFDVVGDIQQLLVTALRPTLNVKSNNLPLKATGLVTTHTGTRLMPGAVRRESNRIYISHRMARGEFVMA